MNRLAHVVRHDHIHEQQQLLLLHCVVNKLVHLNLPFLLQGYNGLLIVLLQKLLAHR